ncbi:MAG: O-antigen ligase family protein [Patescibacteria group bacterium]
MLENALTKINSLFDRFFWRLLGLAVLLELLSFLAFFYRPLEIASFFIILIIVAILTWKNTGYGIYCLLLELILGGQGYLFFWDLSGFKISLRLGLFLIIFIIWAIKTLLKKDFSWLENRFFIWFIVFVLLIASSTINALFNHRPLSDIFFDGNAFLFWGLIGLYLSAKIDWQKILKIFLAGSLVISLKTVLVLVFFSRHWAYVNDGVLYKWLRDTRVGEITAITDNLFRIFFQSHIYSVLAICLVIALLFIGTKNSLLSKKIQLGLIIIIWFNALALIISQSRSFWLALAILLIIFAGTLLFYFKSWRKTAVLIVSTILVLLTVNFATGLIIGQPSLNIFYQRVSATASGEAGASSRAAQLMPLLKEIKKSPLWGEGLGAKVSYISSDPRVLEQNPTGLTSTYAFELNYLDLTLKFGLIGLIVYLSFYFLLVKKIRPSLKNKNPIVWGLALGLAGLAVINIFTPYLNHPLGIGYLLLSMNIFNDLS